MTVALLLSPLLLSAQGRGQGAHAIPNRYIVLLKDGVDIDAASADIAVKHGGQVDHLYKHALKGFSAELSDARVAELKNDPRIAAISEDYEVFMDAAATAKGGKPQPPPPVQALPTGVDRINAETKTVNGTGIEVAVIDTGIDLTHPDLQANILGGKNCVPRSSSYADGNGHGTHVAGTIAAINNTIGVVGVAPKAKLWSVRVLDNNGSGTWSSVICGIDFVTSQASHIRVANMSLGGTGTSDNCASPTVSALHRAICNSVAAGVTYVVAAGNESDDVKNHVPAAYPEVIAASALTDSNGKACGGGASTGYGADDAFASFSNYATLLADTGRIIGAPGVNILSTWKGGGLNTISGTSMATPHVSGAAALYLQAHPGSTPAQVLAGLLGVAEQKNVNMNNECMSGFSHTASVLHPEPVLRADSL